MGSFSIWHWLIVFVIVAIFMGPAVIRKSRRGPPPQPARIHVYAPTQYICAAIHTGRIDARSTIRRLEDRHKARLPELGLNTARVLFEAKQAQRRDQLFSMLSLIVPVWIIVLLFDLESVAG